MVNRVWRYHFGRGLVETPNDFGVRGQPPSHPELLDWLAAEFMSSGWSLKQLHRLIMTSRTYQLASRPDDPTTTNASSRALSPAEELERTQLFGRYPRRRLEAEAIRDAMLAVSGQLDRTQGAEHPFPDPAGWGFTQHGPFYADYPTKRRSVYVMTQRIQAHPFLTLFDAADPSTSTAARIETTTPTQALYLMNSPFVHEQAGHMAGRLMSHTDNDDDRVRFAFQLALGRPASDEEVVTSLAFLERYREGLAATDKSEEEREKSSWSALARTILVRNEFLFVE